MNKYKISYIDGLTNHYKTVEVVAESEAEAKAIIRSRDDGDFEHQWVHITEEPWEVPEEVTKESFDRLLWDILLEHVGHKVEIVVYGDPGNPASVTLEDLVADSVVLDAGIYTICAREDG